MKTLIKIIILLITCLNLSFSQQSELDSIKSELNNLVDEEKVDYIISIPDDYFISDSEFIHDILLYGQRLAEKLDYSEGIILIKKRLGYYYRIKGSYIKALEIYFSALELAAEPDDLKITSDIQNEIGHVYNYLANFTSAREYYELALQKRIQLNDTVKIAASNNNIGNIYKNLGNYEVALDYLTTALELNLKTGNQKNALPTLVNLGNVTRLLKKYKMSEDYYIEALSLSKKANKDLMCAIIQNRLGELYIENGDISKAEKSVKTAYAYLVEKNIPHSLMESYNLLAKINSSKGDYKQAAKYFSEYNNLRDSLYSNQIAKSTAEFEAVYDSQNKEREIRNLEIKQNKYERNFFIFVSAGLVVLALLLYFRIKEWNRINKEIESKNRDLQAAIKQAQKANQLKFEFLAQMSHEIRAPINVLLSFSSLIREEVSDKISNDLKESFASMDRAGNRIIRTIDLLLNMSELQTGTYEPEIRSIDLFEEVISPIHREYKTLAADKKIEFEIKNNTKETIIRGDEYTVSQIFLNLVDNAFKYTPSGKVAILIESEDSKLAVSVIDTGIGISQEFQQDIFNPFTQEEQGYTRKYEGNGLGLALVKSYCEMNNAVIDLISEKGKGSCFKVTFPLN